MVPGGGCNFRQLTEDIPLCPVALAGGALLHSLRRNPNLVCIMILWIDTLGSAECINVVITVNIGCHGLQITQVNNAFANA